MLTRKSILCWVGIVLVSIRFVQAGKQELPASNSLSTSSTHRVILNRYCVTCHNEKLKTADLMLDKVDVEKVTEHTEVWEKVVRKLRAESMPPAGMPRPDEATYNSLATYLEAALDSLAAAKPNPGRPAVHRLNRTEYANAIRDLLGLEVDSESLLPADDSDHGFDNIGSSLSVSPTLLERYMSAAETISRLAIGDPTIRPVVETYDVPKLLMQGDRMNENLPFGSRGGVAIDHYFPLDGEYVIRIHLRKNDYDYFVGLAEPHQIEVNLDGAQIKQFTVGGEHKGRSGPPYSTLITTLLVDPLYSKAVNELLGEPEQEEYERITADIPLEVRFEAQAGKRIVGVDFLDKARKPEGVLQPLPTSDGRSRFYKGGDPAVGSVSIAGPYNARRPGNTPSRGKIFLCHPAGSEQEVSCARKILTALARRAYRRPVKDEDIETLMGFYGSGRTQGGFEAGVGMALQRLLVDSEFLFRIEHDPPNAEPDTAYRISDLELASRMSFFLWSSIPDEELLEFAVSGKLKDPVTLRQQVRRMLSDSRAQALVSNFAGQWLYVRNMKSVVPDAQLFPEFDENLRQAFQQETNLFLESMLREDHSLLELLNANYTFLNQQLARHYGIHNINGSNFRRVILTDETRKGLLGHGSILTVTSYANRTSPTVRGKWVLENLLGAPPPPPPPNVNTALADKKPDGAVLSVRQQLEQHRSNPICASCHAQMDPLGFALENFDAIGKWRTTEANAPIDVSAILPDGTRFQGPSELRNILLSKPEQFVTAVTEKLLTYALGRGVEHFDQPAIRKIVRSAASSNYRWTSIITGIIESTPFQMRRAHRNDDF